MKYVLWEELLLSLNQERYLDPKLQLILQLNPKNKNIPHKISLSKLQPLRSQKH